MIHLFATDRQTLQSKRMQVAITLTHSVTQHTSRRFSPCFTFVLYFFPPFFLSSFLSDFSLLVTFLFPSLCSCFCFLPFFPFIVLLPFLFVCLYFCLPCLPMVFSFSCLLLSTYVATLTKKAVDLPETSVHLSDNTETQSYNSHFHSDRHDNLKSRFFPYGCSRVLGLYSASAYRQTFLLSPKKLVSRFFVPLTSSTPRR